MSNNRRSRSRGATSPGGHTATADFSHLARNDKGGVLIADAEIEAAFKFLAKPGADAVTLSDLRSKLQPFFPDMPLSELRFLLGDVTKKDISLGEVKALLRDNDITGFDPVAEAFRVFDLGGGVADLDILRDVFEHAGFEHLAPDDMKVLLETADVDGDGQITLADFRGMLAKVAANAAAAAAAEKDKRRPDSASSASRSPVAGRKEEGTSVSSARRAAGGESARGRSPRVEV